MFSTTDSGSKSRALQPEVPSPGAREAPSKDSQAQGPGSTESSGTQFRAPWLLSKQLCIS